MSKMEDRLSMLTLGAAIALAKAGVSEQARAIVAEILEDFSDGITLKGSVDYYGDLPASPDTGDEYIVLYSGSSGTNYIGEKYVWDGTAWRSMGTELKLYRDTDGDLCEED